MIFQQNGHHVIHFYMKGISVSRWTEVVSRRGEKIDLRKGLFFDY